MNFKFLSKLISKIKLDPLTMYHHYHAPDFNHKLQNLLTILELPKEYRLAERFKAIEKILDRTFRLELLYRLQLIKFEQANLEGPIEHEGSHLQLLLHLWCLLGITNSIKYISDYLELSIEEVQELIRELHNTFSIASLASRVRQYYEANKHLQKIPELRKESELLGIETTFEPKDITEDRKQKLRRRYGRLVNVFERI